MRIRKNAKVSPVLMMYSSSSSHASAPEGALQTHVCQLNQSPWDVIPFSQYSLLTEGEDFNSCFTGNGSLGESIGAVESSVASMMDIGEDNNPAMNKGENNNVIIMDEKCARKINNNKNDNKKKAVKVANDNGMGRGNLIMGLCQKNDGKGWQCKREAKENYNFCEHHLSLFRSYNNSNTTANNNNNTVDTTASKQKSAAATIRRTRGASAAAKRPSSSNSNPYEFYYYSGFGPLWARRRGERGDHGGGGGGGDSDKAEIKAAVENSNSSERSTPPLSSTTTTTLKIENNREFDYVEDEDEDEEDDVVSGDSGKKRMRKPVKARSLKSLM